MKDQLSHSLLERLRPIFDRVLLVCAFGYALGYLIYIGSVMPVTSRADYVYHLHLMARWWENGQSLEILRWVFEVQSGHPIVPSKILALMNFSLFSYSAKVSNVIAVGTLAFVIGAVFWIYWRLLPRGLARSASMLLAAFSLLNPTFHEVFSYSEAVPPIFLSAPLMLLSTYLFFLLALQDFAGPRATARLIASAGLALLCSLTNGAGLVVFPALITLAFFVFYLGPVRSLGAQAKRRACLSILGCALLAVAFRVLPDKLGTVDGTPAFQPLLFARYFLAVTISPLLQRNVPDAAWLGLLLCLLLAYVGWLSFKNDRERFPLWASWIAFGLASAAAISLARAGRENVVPSRYAVYILPLYLGFIPALVTVLGKKLGTRHRVILPLALLTLSGLAGPKIYDSLRANQTKYVAINSETDLFTRGTPLMRVDCVFRWNGGLPVASWLIETLPRFKRLGIAAAVFRDYRLPDDEFLAEIGLTRDQLAHSTPGGAAAGYVGHVGPHPKPEWIGGYPPNHDLQRFGESGFVEGEFEFVTFRGVALARPTWVFAVDRLGQVMGVSKPMPSVYVSASEAGGDAASEGYFDFTCAIPKGSFVRPYSVVSWSPTQWARLPLRTR